MLTHKVQMATTDICALAFNWIFTRINFLILIRVCIKILYNLLSILSMINWVLYYHHHVKTIITINIKNFATSLTAAHPRFLHLALISR